MRLQLHEFLDLLHEVLNSFITTSVLLIQEYEIIQGEYLLFGVFLLQLFPFETPLFI